MEVFERNAYDEKYRNCNIYLTRFFINRPEGVYFAKQLSCRRTLSSTAESTTCRTQKFNVAISIKLVAITRQDSQVRVGADS